VGVNRKEKVMYVRKRGNLYQCCLRYKGSRLQKSFHKKSSAIAWGHKTLTELETGSYQDRDKLFSITLKDLLKLYYDHTKDSSRRLKNFTYEIDSMCRLDIAKLPLAQITPVKIAKLKNELAKDNAPATVRKKLLLLGRVFNIGQRELGIPINNNPVKLVSLPRDPEHRDRVLTADEYKRLLHECSKSSLYYLKYIVELAFETICRRGEVLNLSINDCNLNDGTAQLMVTKNNKKRRIGLSVRACEIIRNLPRNIDGSIFPKISISIIDKEFRRAVKRANISNFRFHDIRHSGATFLAESGWSTVELMAQGGWSSAEMVKKYANISAKHLSNKLRSQK
jgi:integrase